MAHYRRSKPRTLSSSSLSRRFMSIATSGAGGNCPQPCERIRRLRTLVDVCTAPAPGSTRTSRTTAAPRPSAQLRHQGARPQATRRGDRTRAAKHKRRKGQPPLRKLPREQNRRLSSHKSSVYASPGRVWRAKGGTTHTASQEGASASRFCPARAPRKRRRPADSAGA